MLEKKFHNAVEHFSEQVSQIFDVLIGLTERIDKIEKFLAENKQWSIVINPIKDGKN
jgi:hypothetical protein